MTIITRVDVSVNRTNLSALIPKHFKEGKNLNDWTEDLRPAEYSLDHLSIYLHPDQKEEPLTGQNIFESIKGKIDGSFLSLVDGHGLQSLGAKFIEKFGREVQYVLWGTVILMDDGHWVPIIYGAQRSDYVFIVWDNLKHDSFNKSRPGLRFSTPGN